MTQFLWKAWHNKSSSRRSQTTACFSLYPPLPFLLSHSPPSPSSSTPHQFRGFTNTFRSFETEARADKDKGFQVDKIIEELFGYVTASDVIALIEYWRYLDVRYFSRLDSRFQRTVKKFELCLLRHYLVHASQHKRREKIVEFFEIYGADLYNNPEWTRWFGLPYSKNPATEPTFETFFSKQWLDNFTVSLHNFLNTIFQNMRAYFSNLLTFPHTLPSLLAFNIDRLQRRTLQLEIETLRNVVEQLRTEISSGENEISSLKLKVKQSQTDQTTTASSARRRASSLADVATGNKVKPPTSRSAASSSFITRTAKTATLTVAGATDTAAAAVPVKSKSSEVPPKQVSMFDLLPRSSTSSTLTRSAPTTQLEEAPAPAVVGEEAAESQEAEVDIEIEIVEVEREQEADVDGSLISTPNSEGGADEEPFMIMSQDEFLEHNSGIVHARFSSEGNLIASCDMDNIVRVSQLSCSPVEPIFVGAAAPRSETADVPGVLVSWNMRTMAKEAAGQSTAVSTIRFNHNGQMLMAGDEGGFIRIFDIRTLTSIMVWQNPSGQGLCSAQFSFDENSIYAVDDGGVLTQWSIHKPGTKLSQSSLPGFPPAPPFTPRPPTEPSSSSPSTPPRLKRRPSSSSVSSRLSMRSSHRNSLVPAISFDDTVTQTLLARSPRAQMVAFSVDTEHVLVASSGVPEAGVEGEEEEEEEEEEEQGGRDIPHHPLSPSALRHQARRPSGPGLQGIVYQSTSGRVVQPLAPHTQPISVVDWAATVNACLTGGVDGTIRVTKLIRV
ncbi:hypothetical protein BC937DRAFT_91464 [Endogone sp. FLAS-F59071]|nr:hypothetical protein BC937DRAFT_91464 [Endogone sp. FLAS-F59071]|eukprot:RUS21790.1 hypothetical protein BC937DRAFT_91464 [Endogone sp. FLAS-F59071]